MQLNFALYENIESESINVKVVISKTLSQII
jgi:hypothetical protein